MSEQEKQQEQKPSAEDWARENAEFIAEYNKRVAREGTLLEEFRTV